jgi:glyoxylase-like metal-dependent hydrolase (beta-lactamase superfamily II)
VLVVGFPALAFDTNCYLLATQAGEECVIVDPGIGVVDTVAEVLAEHRLRPAAVLLTHGHADHVYSVTPVCRTGGTPVPALIHGDDEYRLANPLAAMDPMLVAMLEQEFGQQATWTEPDEVRTLKDGELLDVAGLRLTVDHAPGHTEGSVLFHLPDAAEVPVCLSGDVLFAGSIGRTDLPGGDQAAMQRSLRDKILPLADETVVLPGHGPETTIGRERRVNPFLRGLRTSGPLWR